MGLLIGYMPMPPPFIINPKERLGILVVLVVALVFRDEDGATKLEKGISNVGNGISNVGNGISNVGVGIGVGCIAIAIAISSTNRK